MESSQPFHEYLSQKRKIIEQALEQCLPAKVTPPLLFEAMRYSVFAGGKRLRPIMLLMTAEMLGRDCQTVAFAGAALEMVHTYSLIHDDLPAMDNDDLRRGRPTNHKVYGEAMAILAGDALLTMAFQVMSEPYYTSSFEPQAILAATQELALAAGAEGMVGGQVFDMQAEGKLITQEQLEAIHRNKTGKMLSAAVRIGAMLSGATEQQLDVMSAYGDHVGLAFQIVDDVLDLEGTAEELGKNPTSDLQHEKATYPALYGLDESKSMVRELTSRAKQSLRMFGDRAEYFLQLADFMAARTH
ncbi:polyprenyl synthetase [candidate division KSB3 bacterium]|uniref:Polyprenyl synthetase n=1 Tax=candidate division KSB3 bacterium TaxID=2044937 RepID=A0A2G6KCT0_9BACT|nr:MAG: polyprenyl synthetase [candidate division KSB3 bacterium]